MIAVKLKGVTEEIKPDNGLYWDIFVTFSGEIGCLLCISAAY